MKFEPPERSGDFEPHPTGNHTGTITEIKDYGMMESLYKDRMGNTKEVHRIGIVITSDTATMDGPEVPFDAVFLLPFRRFPEMVVQPDEIERSANPGDAGNHMKPAD